MVVIHIKSTIDRDEFLYQTPAAADVADIITDLVHLHNARVRLRSQASALYNLLNEDGGAHSAAKSDEQRNLLSALHDEVRAIVAPERVVEKACFDRAALHDLLSRVEAAAVATYEECRDDAPADGSEAAPATAADKLWKAREEGDTPEDDRLRAYYFLELVDPEFRGKDFYAADTAKLWWAGKELVRGGPLKGYTGANEKSKIVGKLSGDKQGCPAREARMALAQQRDLRQHFLGKQEEFKALEASELAAHKNVRRDPADYVAFRAPCSNGERLFGDGSRGAVDPHAKAAGDGIISLNTNVKKISHPTCGP